MCSSYLPSLDFSQSVLAERARQDKIQINVQWGIIQGNADDVRLFLNYLGAPPRDHTGEERNIFGRIFTRQQGRTPRFNEQLIRSEPTRNQPSPPPLFSGHLRVWDRGSGIWSLETLLSLNPTRFLHHQRLPIPWRTPPRFRYNLYAGNVASEHNGEFALTDWDNWIPNSRRWSLFASPQYWNQHLRAYITRSIREVRDDLRRAARLTEVEIHESVHSNPYNLQSVETYWEFYSQNPLSTVHELQRLLESYSRHHIRSEDYPIKVSIEAMENSRCLNLQTRVGETLKIYAKTSRRIRFEVKHRLNGDHPYALGSRHTFSKGEDILACLDHLASVATTRINHALNHFRRRDSAADSQYTILVFLTNFLSAFDDPARACDLLHILTDKLSIVVGKGIPIRKCFDNELRKLVRNGVLTNSNYKYSVAPEYTRALEALKDLRGDRAGIILGIRRRPTS